VKAIVYERYGGPDVVELREVPDPTPKEREVLVRVRATTVESGDARMRALRVPKGFGLPVRLMFGITKPRRQVLGFSFAGEVVATGTKVTKLAVGDEIFGLVGSRGGCHAELLALPESAAWAKKPPSVSFEDAAALPFGGHTVLDFFERGGVRGGERVLVVGASGSVGVAAVQIAKNHLGCEVTGVCSAKNAPLVSSLGADRVIDYEREDFAALGESWDVIVDTAGTAPFARSKGVLREGGRLLAVLGTFPEMVGAPWVGLTSDKRVTVGTGPERAENLALLADLAASGKLRTIVSAVLPFSRASEAHALVDTGHKVGSVVLVPDALYRDGPPRVAEAQSATP
jgi:NADPH:quinone reductase-like Zn-dependent oxidoreductase